MDIEKLKPGSLLTGLFVIAALTPGYGYMFVKHRDLFYKLDSFKLTVLSLLPTLLTLTSMIILLFVLEVKNVSREIKDAVNVNPMSPERPDLLTTLKIKIAEKLPYIIIASAILNICVWGGALMLLRSMNGSMNESITFIVAISTMAIIFYILKYRRLF